MAEIFICSPVPGNTEENILIVFNLLNPALQDLLHIPLYGICKFPWLRSFARLGKKKNGSYYDLYGIFDEIHQMFVPGRYGSFEDMFLNIFGVFFGTGLFLMFQHSQADTIR